MTTTHDQPFLVEVNRAPEGQIPKWGVVGRMTGLVDAVRVGQVAAATFVSVRVTQDGVLFAEWRAGRRLEDDESRYPEKRRQQRFSAARAGGRSRWVGRPKKAQQPLGAAIGSSEPVSPHPSAEGAPGALVDSAGGRAESSQAKVSAKLDRPVVRVVDHGQVIEYEVVWDGR